MRVFKVYPTVQNHSDFPRTRSDRKEFYTSNAFDLNSVPVGSLIEVREMTEEQYKAIRSVQDFASPQRLGMSHSEQHRMAEKVLSHYKLPGQ